MSATILAFERAGDRARRRALRAPQGFVTLSEFCQTQASGTSRGSGDAWWESLERVAGQAVLDRGSDEAGDEGGGRDTFVTHAASAFVGALHSASEKSDLRMIREDKDYLVVFDDVVIEMHHSSMRMFLTAAMAALPEDRDASIATLVERLHPGRRYVGQAETRSLDFTVTGGVDGFEGVIRDVALAANLVDRGVATIEVTSGVPGEMPPQVAFVGRDLREIHETDESRATVERALVRTVREFAPEGHRWVPCSAPLWIEGGRERRSVVHAIGLGEPAASATLRTIDFVAKAAARVAARERLVTWAKSRGGGLLDLILDVTGRD